MLYLLLPALLVAVLLYYVFSGRSASRVVSHARQPGRKYAPDLPTAAPAFHWEDGGRYDAEVENEAVYQAVIKDLAGAHGDQNANTRHLAILVPDDVNPYQDKAVAVFIAGQLVGYLTHGDALRLRRKLGRKDLAGQPTSCDAVIRGGGAWHGKRLAYAVWLDLQPFD